MHVTQKRWRNFFGEKFFPRKIALYIQNLALTTLPTKICQWSETFLLKVREGQSELSVWNYFYISPKWSFSKVGCSFGNPASSASLKVRHFLMENQKREKSSFISINFFSRYVLRGRRNQFSKRCRNFSAKTPKLFAQSPQSKKIVSFQGSFLCKKFYWASRKLL